MKLTLSRVISPLIILLVWWFHYQYYAFTLLQEYWQIAVTMVFGSFIAGATSEGGGAIAFPVFTKVLNIAPIDAKIFSLAIQSVGMSAATLTIILLRIRIEWRVICWASIGGVFGMLTGAILITPLLPPTLVKMLFTAMVVSFALTLCCLNWQQRFYNTRLIRFAAPEKFIMLAAGFFGGIMSGLVGNGIDIICFSVMVLLFRLSEKVATPTSVVLMAINAIVGFSLYRWGLDGFTPQLQDYWLAAIPVVVIGAPLGAYCCSKLKNKTIANCLIFLILIELISSLLIIPLNAQILMISGLVLLLFLIVYYLMIQVSRRMRDGVE